MPLVKFSKLGHTKLDNYVDWTFNATKGQKRTPKVLNLKNTQKNEILAVNTHECIGKPLHKIKIRSNSDSNNILIW